MGVSEVDNEYIRAGRKGPRWVGKGEGTEGGGKKGARYGFQFNNCI